MTRPEGAPDGSGLVDQEAGRPSRLGRLSAGLAGAAVLIGAVTMVARAVGFGRYLVFSRTVGQTCLGDVYLTANMVPTLVFEAVVGGALASLVVPVLAAPLARGAVTEVQRIASALLTWTLLLLLPLTVAGVFAARPIMELLLGGSKCPGAIDAGTRMLLIFLPQVLLYGVAVVLYGVLQAHRRFLGPAVAPLANSLVLVASYAGFRVLAGSERPENVAAGATGLQLVLAIGATCGVAALVGVVVVPLARTGVRIRPALSFPPGTASRVRALAGAGVATLAAQQLVVAAVLAIANHLGQPGSVPLYTYAWQIFHLPYAVLAVPVALSTFPALSARVAAGDLTGYAAATAAATRSLLLLTTAAAAVLAVVAAPVARVFVLGAPGDVDPAVLRWTIVAFAPGLVGFGLVAHLGRALYAAGRNRMSAGSVVIGWAIVLVADIGFAAIFPGRWTVVAFGLGNTIGMTVAGTLLLVATRATGGRAAVTRAGRVLLAGFLGGMAGYGAGAAAVAWIGPVGVWASVVVCLVGAAIATLIFVSVAFLVNAPDVRAVIGRMRRT